MSLIVQQNFIDIRVVKHDCVVVRTGNEGDPSFREMLPQCPQQRYAAQHVTQLIVLTHDQYRSDGPDGKAFEGNYGKNKFRGTKEDRLEPLFYVSTTHDEAVAFRKVCLFPL
ncbi:MAG: hypothetical protein V3U69_01300 [Bacteroidota bacterium]